MTAMDAATWTLITVVLGAVVAFAVEIRTSSRSLRTDLGHDITSLDQKITGLDQKIDTKVDTLRTDLGHDITSLDQKITGLDQKVTGLDQKIDTLGHRMDALERRLDALEHRLDTLQHEVDTFSRIQERMAGQLDVLVAMAAHPNFRSPWVTSSTVDPAIPPGPAPAA